MSANPTRIGHNLDFTLDTHCCTRCILPDYCVTVECRPSTDDNPEAVAEVARIAKEYAP